MQTTTDTNAGITITRTENIYGHVYRTVAYVVSGVAGYGVFDKDNTDLASTARNYTIGETDEMHLVLEMLGEGLAKLDLLVGNFA